MQDPVKLIEIFIRKHTLNESQKDALLCDLMGSYLGKNQSDLMEFLIKGEMTEFISLVEYMTKKGSKIKRS